MTPLPPHHDISVSFRTLAHFFDTDDPSPESFRELTDRAEEEIAKSVTYILKTIPPDKQGDLIISLPPSDMNDNRKKDLPLAVIHHFQNRISDLERDKKLTWWVGMREFRLTVAVLIPALAGIGLTHFIQKDVVALIVQNILVICSWVVIWQPFQILVFDRWSLATKIRIYNHITRMNIVVKEDSSRNGT